MNPVIRRVALCDIVNFIANQPFRQSHYSPIYSIFLYFFSSILRYTAFSFVIPSASNRLVELMHILEISFQEKCAIIGEGVDIILKTNVSGTKFNTI